MLFFSSSTPRCPFTWIRSIALKIPLILNRASQHQNLFQVDTGTKHRGTSVVDKARDEHRTFIRGDHWLYAKFIDVLGDKWLM